MRYCTISPNLALAAVIIFIGIAQSQIDEANNTTANSSLPLNIIEQQANISIASVVYEVNPNEIISFGDNRLETAKQEIYNITITNTGEVTLDDVLVSISAVEGMIFMNFAYYDSSDNMQVECTRPDLCQRVSTDLIRNIGSLKSNESKSILINAYIKPQIESKQINVRAIGAKPKGTVSDVRSSAELAECIFVDSNGMPCAEKREGCICQRPTWTDAFGSPVAKPRIPLKQIIVTNTIYKIETAKGKRYEQNSNDMPDIERYIPSEADNVTYLITVSNTDCNNSLKQIQVVDELPDGMIYASSNITVNRTSVQIPPNVNGNKITWAFDEIKPNTQVLIKHTAVFHRMNDLRRFENKVYAEGIWDTQYALIEDQSQVVSLVLPA